TRRLLLLAVCTTALLHAEDGTITAPPAQIAETSNSGTMPATLDPEAALERILSTYAELQAAERRLAAARLQAASRLGFTRPQVDAQASVYYVDGFRTGVGIGTTNEDYRAQLSARQLLYGFGARAAAWALTRRDVAYQARSAIAALFLARQRVAIAEARLELREAEYADAENLFAAGSIAAIDVRQAELSRIQAEDSLRAERTILDNQIENLAVLLDQSTSAFRIQGELSRIDDFDALEAHVTGAIADGNAETAAIATTLQARQAQIDALHAADKPQFHVAGDYGWRGQETDDLEDGWGVGLEASWRFDGGSRHQQRAQLREEIVALGHEDSLARDRIRADLAKLHNNRLSLAERIQRQQTAIALAEDNYTDTRQLYSAGRITLTRVTEANLALVEARFRLADLIYTENLVAFDMIRLAE
ncbi:MAG: TolC family protein, partial [Planctomycetota bacterium]